MSSGTRRSSPRKGDIPVEEDEMSQPIHQDNLDLEEDEYEEEQITQNNQDQIAPGEEQVPVKRKRGRPPSKNKRIMPDIDMNMTSSDPNEEEIDHPHIFDAKGEEKITPDGYLLGGREYRFRTYVLPRHPTRLYCFALEAAKILGYRDSYILYSRNPHIKRLIASDEDREFLVQNNEMPSMYRNRPLALCNPRILFKNFGHQVIVRGIPVRDDYQVGDRVESASYEYQEGVRYDDDESEFGGEFARKLASIEGGPFHHLGNAALRFNTKLLAEEDLGSLKPALVPLILAEDNWMYKCALSAAEFNQRLNRLRPISFLDLHTNVEQVPLASQPSHIQVEMLKGSECTPGKADTATLAHRAGDDSKDSGWVPTVITKDHSRYPLAIMKGQQQTMSSLYLERFRDTDSQFYTATHEVINGQGPLGSNSNENLPSPWDAVVTFQSEPVSQSNNEKESSSSTKKRGRPRLHEDVGVCCHCNSISAPSFANTNPGIPPNLLLACTKCATKHHPACLEFDDIVMLSTIQTYDWYCSSCKVCSHCSNPDDDDRLLFCDTCDRGYHTYCLEPPLEELPEGSWLCPMCAVCRSCEKRPPQGEHIPPEDLWEHVVLAPKPEEAKQSVGCYFATYCKNCHGDFEQDRFCPFCLKTYKEDSDDVPMACCDSCERWIHVGCDPYLTQRAYEKLTQNNDTQYQCSFCNPSQRDAMYHKKKLRKDGKHTRLVEYKGHWLFTPAYTASQ